MDRDDEARDDEATATLCERGLVVVSILILLWAIVV